MKTLYILVTALLLMSCDNFQQVTEVEAHKCEVKEVEVEVPVRVYHYKWKIRITDFAGSRDVPARYTYIYCNKFKMKNKGHEIDFFIDGEWNTLYAHRTMTVTQHMK